MEHVIDIKHHLGEQPVVRSVKRRVNEVRSYVGLDCQGQEILRLRMNEEVGRASCPIPLWFYSSLVILFLITILSTVNRGLIYDISAKGNLRST